MALDPDRVYDAMVCAYRHGVLEKMANIQGHAMQRAMERKGLNMNEFINGLDEMEEEKLFKLDRMLNRYNFLVKMATSNLLMKIVSWLLNLRFIRKIMIKISELIFARLLGTREGALT